MAFILPFVPWIIGALLGAGALAGLHELFKPAAGSVFAILGERQSGKTVLIRFIGQGIVGDAEYRETSTPEAVKGRKIELEDGTRFYVADLLDFSGDESDWKTWKKRVRESDRVIYLLRSHLLRTGRGTARDRCRRDLQLLDLWLREMQREGARVPRVILAFSFRDKDTDLNTAPADYARELIAIGGLRKIVDKLKQTATVAIAAGSMESEESTRSFLAQIGKAL